MRADAVLVRLMREVSGLGLHACRAAAVDAEENLDGDYVLALIHADVNGHAVFVKPRDPSETPAQARRRHMLAHAETLRADRMKRPGWTELSAMSDAINGRS